MKRKICVVTGTRAEYGLLKPIMRQIKNTSVLQLNLVVTGMHLSSEFGRSVELIKRDGFKIAASVPMHPKDDQKGSMGIAVGEGIIGLTKTFQKIKPDVVLILGDRIEALAAAVAAAYTNTIIAHIHGGDVSQGGIDESVRHAITKLAQIHFAATPRSRERIIKMGEKSRNVFYVGAPGLDVILHEKLLSRDELSRQLGVNFDRPVAVLLQHAVTTQVKQAGQQIKETLEALKQSGLSVIGIYPNSDSGGRRMIKEIEEYTRYPNFTVFRNIPREQYLGILKYASVMVGNSSSGIIESASFKLPVINIGIRQRGRERSTNVLDVSPRRLAIAAALQKALHDPHFRRTVAHCKSPYGDGHASERIIKTLKNISLNQELLQKQLTY
jgi:UDP-hydrolysing UDP-N-acetyl-D-glucosamine 2-epimerase